MCGKTIFASELPKPLQMDRFSRKFLTLLHFFLISTQANSRPDLKPGRLECLAPDAEQRRRRQRGDDRADDQEQHNRDDDDDGGIAERLVFRRLHQHRQTQIEEIEHIEAERSEERRVGKADVSTSRWRWTPCHKKKK